MKIYFSIILIILSTFYVESNSLRVLGILPFASRSHHSVGSNILLSLVDAGHEATVISAYPLKNKVKNYRDVPVMSILEVLEKGDETNPYIFGKYPAIGGIFMLSKLNIETVELFMNDKDVQNFLKEDHQFDVCLFEIFLVDALLGIAEKYNCILISYATFASVLWTNDITGNVLPTSYVPNPFSANLDRMNFNERLSNTALSLAEELLHHAYYLPNQRRLYQKYFPNAKKSFDEMYRNTSIIFMNTHVSSSTVRPHMPNQVEIAGIHVKPANPLPNDIQEFLDSASDGAILFSMGSFIQSKMWPEDKRNALVKSFGKLKMKVLWKYENETLPNNPGNIKISPWIPQRDILAHPNIKIFITHGGLLGTTEAVVEGVPVLGLPIFGDQKMNMAKAVTRGYGLQIYFDDINEEKIDEALNELLNNPTYSERAKEISQRFNDRPMTPQQSVVYWTEYAVRHHGAAHLKAAAADLNFIELHLIDVYVALAAIALIILYIDYKILKFILSKCFTKSAKKVKKN